MIVLYIVEHVRLWPKAAIQPDFLNDRFRPIPASQILTLNNRVGSVADKDQSSENRQARQYKYHQMIITGFGIGGIRRRAPSTFAS